MSLNNRTTKQLNDKVVAGEKSARRRAVEFTESLERMLVDGKADTETKLLAAIALLGEHNKREYESAMRLDEVREIRDSQVWMEGRK